MMKSILLYMSDQPTLKNFVTGFSFSRKTARRFVAGETIEEAIAAIQDLNRRKFHVTLDNLGESVKSKEEAIGARDEYLKALDAIHRVSVDSNVSLKLTQFGLDIDEAFCRDNVESVITRAREQNNFVRIDMEGSPHTDATLRILTGLRKKYDNVGIVLQAYLFRTEKDLQDVLALGCLVRLCKGAYKEPPEISFKDKKHTDENFVKLTKVLLKSGLYHAIATHDPNMIQATKSFADAEKIDRNTFEFQMLYGIRRDLQDQLVSEGYHVRIYVPYGSHWYPYLMRRMAERPANLFFVARNLFRG